MDQLAAIIGMWVFGGLGLALLVASRILFTQPANESQEKIEDGRDRA
jgi:hypothetical protein